MSVSKRNILLTEFFSNARRILSRDTNSLQNFSKLHRSNGKSFHTGTHLEKLVAFNLSDIGEGIREVVVKQWFIKAGDKVSQFDEICEVQSDKASVTITSRYDGVIKKLHYKVDDVALVGKPLLDIETESDDGQVPEKVEVPKVEKTTENVLTDSPIKKETKESIIHKDSSDGEVLCLPSVRRLAKENKVNLSDIKGTGKNDRITREDLLSYLQGREKSSTASPKHSEESSNEYAEPLKGFQKSMVKSMTESLKLPLFTYGDEISVKKLTQLKDILKTIPELADIKISYMPFFIKAMSNALLKYPILNSYYDEKSESVIHRRQHNVGVAMDTKLGLAIPVIKGVQNLSIIEIAKELERLLKSGRDGTFSLSDTSGVSTLISNIGTIGGTYVKPLPVAKTSAILAFGRIQVLPRFDSSMNVIADEIVVLSGSADHRIIDGATMARFVQDFKKQIENPYLILLKL